MEDYSTREYLRFVFLNPSSILALLDTVLVSITTPEHGVLSGTFLLFGVIVFPFGFTRAQHRLKRTE